MVDFEKALLKTKLEKLERVMRGVKITAMEIIEDIDSGDLARAKMHAQLIFDTMSALQPEPPIANEPCKHENTELNPYDSIFYCQNCGMRVISKLDIAKGDVVGHDPYKHYPQNKPMKHPGS